MNAIISWDKQTMDVRGRQVGRLAGRQDDERREIDDGGSLGGDLH